jgi:hypothetical protein
LIGWNASTVSLPIIFAQLACPVKNIIFCLFTLSGPYSTCLGSDPFFQGDNSGRFRLVVIEHLDEPVAHHRVWTGHGRLGLYRIGKRHLQIQNEQRLSL